MLKAAIFADTALWLCRAVLHATVLAAILDQLSQSLPDRAQTEQLCSGSHFGSGVTDEAHFLAEGSCAHLEISVSFVVLC